MQTVCFILVSANSEYLTGVQLDPTRYVKYVGAMRVKAEVRYSNTMNRR